MKKTILAIALMAPGLAFASTHGSRVGLSFSTNNITINGGGASASVGGVITTGLSLTGDPRVGGSRMRVRTSLDEGRSQGAAYQAFKIGLTPDPHAAFSPVVGIGLLSASGVQAPAYSYTNYSYNPQTFSGSSTTVTVTPPPVSIMTAFVSAGLRYQKFLAPHLRVRGTVSALIGIGGSTSGLPAASNSGSGVGHAIDVALVYDPTPRSQVTIGYGSESLPIRGYSLGASGLTVRAGYRFF